MLKKKNLRSLVQRIVRDFDWVEILCFSSKLDKLILYFLIISFGSYVEVGGKYKKNSGKIRRKMTISSRACFSLSFRAAPANWCWGSAMYIQNSMTLTFCTLRYFDWRMQCMMSILGRNLWRTKIVQQLCFSFKLDKLILYFLIISFGWYVAVGGNYIRIVEKSEKNDD